MPSRELAKYKRNKRAREQEYMVGQLKSYLQKPIKPKTAMITRNDFTNVSHLQVYYIIILIFVVHVGPLLIFAVFC